MKTYKKYSIQVRTLENAIHPLRFSHMIHSRKGNLNYVNVNEIFAIRSIRGDKYMTSTLRGGWRIGKNEMLLSGWSGGRVASVLDVQSLFLLLKKIEFVPCQTLIYF